MKSHEIRKKFIEYFEKQDHKEVKSSSLIPEDDPTVLLTTAGMQQFVPNFLGKPHPDGNRVFSIQKCFRTVDIDDVGDATHGTFFEMMGNWSFGDYFKKDSIHWSFEFLTKELGISPNELSVTVFEGDEVAPYDEESKKIWMEEGIPEERIYALNKDENWWGPAGKTGPCGPDTEIFYHTGKDPEVENPDPSNSPAFMEIWNNVFMQYNKNDQGTYDPLALKCVDTGMGLERITAVLQKKNTVYETDIFEPIIAQIEKMTGKTYPGFEKNDSQFSEDEAVLARSIRIIADHMRGSTFLIGDGVLPSNVGRGYVLRRILRRAIYNAYLLGITEDSLSVVSEIVIDNYKEYYPELADRASTILQEIKMEEERFRKTIARGEQMMEEMIAEAKQTKTPQISGADAFKLYDTFGFPLSLTLEIAKQHQIEVDVDGYQVEFEQQQERSREGAKNMFAKGSEHFDVHLAGIPATEFLGYDCTDVEAAKVLKIIPQEEDTVVLVMDQTPFYAESGGQVGDTGTVMTKSATYEVIDTQKTRDGQFVHICHKQEGEIVEGDVVALSVDKNRRSHVMRSHTCAHLLQAALRKVLQEDVTQKGSYVDDKRVRFDFSFNRALTKEELIAIEEEMNMQIHKAHEVTKQEMSYDEAMKAGALGLFSEKYGDKVRVVDIGDGYSKELCGGTHLDNISELGIVKVLKESSIASGIRRIEVICGMNTYDYLRGQDDILFSVADTLKTTPDLVQEKVQQMSAYVKDLEKLLAEYKNASLNQIAEGLESSIEDKAGKKVLCSLVDGFDMKQLKTIAGKLASKGLVDICLLANKEGQFVLQTSEACDSREIFDTLKTKHDSLTGGGNPNVVQGKGLMDLQMVEL